MDLSKIKNLLDINELRTLIYSNKYVHALFILVLFYLAAKFIVMISKKVFMKAASKTKTVIDDLIIQKVNRPLSLIILLVGVRLAIIVSGLRENESIIVNNIISTLLIIIVAYIVISVFDIVIDNWGKKWAEKTKSNIDDQLINLLHKSSNVVISILTILFILDVWGVKVGPLLASLGIAGIAIAFALQNTLGNIFGGISLIIDKTIKTGDVIKIDKDTRGKVLDIGLRSTRIRTFDNEVIIVPNGSLASSKIQNYVPPDPSVRVVIPFGVAYGSDVDKVKKIVMNEIKKVEGFKKDPEPVVRFLEMADSSLNFKAYFYVDSYTKRFAAIDKANTLIYNALNKNKISIPFPQMDVHLRKK